MTDTSFLPDDYLAKQAERRTSLICLGLFLVVMAGVVGAFLVTNRQWEFVESQQGRINEEYHAVASQIKELEKLEEQRVEMLDRAELASSLVERVPRSILLSELINRMPQRLSLLKFDLDSTKVITRTEPVADQRTGKLSSKAKKAKTKADVAAASQKTEAPRYRVKLAMVGVAPTDLEVSRYLAELNAYPLLREVTLEYSEEKEINERLMREFRLSMELDMDADISQVEPLIRQRGIQDPMRDQLRFNSDGRSSASAN